MVPLKVPVHPYILFLWCGWEIIIKPRLEHQGFSYVLTYIDPYNFYGRGMVFEDAAISLFPDCPHEET